MNIAISPCSSWLQRRDFSLERHLCLSDRNSILLAIANDRQELKAKGSNVNVMNLLYNKTVKIYSLIHDTKKCDMHVHTVPPSFSH